MKPAGSNGHDFDTGCAQEVFKKGVRCGTGCVHNVLAHAQLTAVTRPKYVNRHCVQGRHRSVLICDVQKTSAMTETLVVPESLPTAWRSAPEVAAGVA